MAQVTPPAVAVLGLLLRLPAAACPAGSMSASQSSHHASPAPPAVLLAAGARPLQLLLLQAAAEGLGEAVLVLA